LETLSKKGAPSYIKKRFTGDNPVFSLLGCVYSQNKVTSFTHLEPKDDAFSRVVVFYALLFTRKTIEKYMYLEIK
jgi:hypothetical protein